MLACQKDLFSLPPDAAYLNCAYMSPAPIPAVEAGIAGLRRKANPTTIVAADFFSGPARIRELFARLIHAESPERIALVPSASYAMGIVAKNVTPAPGQNVVTVDQQFPSNVYPWRRLRDDHGVEVRVVAAPGGHRTGTEWNDAVVDAIDKRTAIVAMANVHWTDGTVFDLIAAGTRAREVGALFVVDGTQSIGAMPFDVRVVQPDLVACSAYKWLLGPYSMGVAYVGERLLHGVPLEETWMGRQGSDRFDTLVDYQEQYRAGAARFDVGEASNFALTPMLAASLELLLDWGVERVSRYCGDLAAPTVQRLADAGFGVAPSANRAPHVFGIRLPPGRDPRKVERELAAARVYVSVRGTAVRVSPNVYNDHDDMARLEAVLSGG